jgi:hypothetical protein
MTIFSGISSLLKRIRDYFDPPQSGTVTFKHYIRTGACHSCGACCSGVYLVHNEAVIDTVATFDILKEFHPDYTHFMPLEETEQGVRFKCRHLTEDLKCGIHDDRPLFCRKYPSEATLLYGGQLDPNCGYKLEKRYAFEDILGRVSRQKSLKAGKLLNDV